VAREVFFFARIGEGELLLHLWGRRLLALAVFQLAAEATLAVAVAVAGGRVASAKEVGERRIQCPQMAAVQRCGSAGQVAAAPFSTMAACFRIQCPQMAAALRCGSAGQVAAAPFFDNGRFNQRCGLGITLNGGR
jgi:hypothetical protein